MTTPAQAKNDFMVTLIGDREVAITRTVDAPAQKVFDAFTRPEHLKRWFLPPSGWSMTTCDVDLRVGGTFYYAWRNESEGTEHGLHGTFREIVPGERIVYAEDNDDNGNLGDAVVTTTFAEANGKTTIVIALVFYTAELCQAAVASGQPDGWGMMLDNLVGQLG